MAGNLSQDAVSGALPFVTGTIDADCVWAEDCVADGVLELDGLPFVTGTTDADSVLEEDCVADGFLEEEEEEVGTGGTESCWLAFITQSELVLQL